MTLSDNANRVIALGIVVLAVMLTAYLAIGFIKFDFNLLHFDNYGRAMIIVAGIWAFFAAQDRADR